MIINLEKGLRNNADSAEKTFKRVINGERAPWDWTVVGWRQGRLLEAIHIANRKREKGKLSPQEAAAADKARRVKDDYMEYAEYGDLYVRVSDKIYPQFFFTGFLLSLAYVTAGSPEGTIYALKRPRKLSVPQFQD
ncbi:hypothetical protein K2P56_01090 [Patescibacteria group bacterium]|nr:hypothetical protein [Patescibacteria group bacterium]